MTYFVIATSGRFPIFATPDDDYSTSSDDAQLFESYESAFACAHENETVMELDEATGEVSPAIDPHKGK